MIINRHLSRYLGNNLATHYAAYFFVHLYNLKLTIPTCSQQEELELETSGGNGGLGSSGTSGGLTSTTSMSQLGPPGGLGLDADSLRERQRWTRRWYLLVIVLLYIGLLVSYLPVYCVQLPTYCD